MSPTREAVALLERTLREIGKDCAALEQRAEEIDGYLERVFTLFEAQCGTQRAARHAGVIGAEGGTFDLRILPLSRSNPPDLSD